MRRFFGSCLELGDDAREDEFGLFGLCLELEDEQTPFCLALSETSLELLRA
jgi:hypothetical protein